MAELKNVPYHGNPGNACALACYTMAAQYLLPNEKITFEELGKIADWHKGYVVWAFPVWRWMMDRGVHIDDYDITDFKAWGEEGLEGVRKTVSEKEFEFYKDNSYDLEKTLGAVPEILAHPNFRYTQGEVTWDMIVEAVKKPGICDVTLDGRKLHRVDGFSVHRVVIIGITDTEVIFHDPRLDGQGAYKRESIEFFRSCLDSLSSPELCHYSLVPVS